MMLALPWNRRRCSDSRRKRQGRSRRFLQRHSSSRGGGGEVATATPTELEELSDGAAVIYPICLRVVCYALKKYWQSGRIWLSCEFLLSLSIPSSLRNH